MYGCESWTVKKAECQRIDAFELWCWRRFLRVPWTARRSNQSILKEISPGYSLEVLMLKLKLHCFGHLMQRTDSFEKTLMLGKIEGGRRGDSRGWDGWTASPTQWTWVWVNSKSWWWTGRPGMLQSTRSQSVGHNWVTELNWTDVVHAQSCLTLCSPMDYSPPGSSVHGIFPCKDTRLACHFSFRGSFWLRDQTHISCSSCFRQILCPLSDWVNPISSRYYQPNRLTNSFNSLFIKIVCFPIFPILVTILSSTWNKSFSSLFLSCWT